MYKLFTILIVSLLLISGCSVNIINDDSANDIISTVLYQESKLVNTNYEGYSFYLPQGTKISDKNEYNLRIKDNKYYYYLYVDTIAYHYKTNNAVDLDNNHYYTQTLSNNGLFGYVDIMEYDDKYFVVIMYNYAKIECYINKEDFNSVFTNICNILSSIKFNDKIIDVYVENKKEFSQEESFNIFSSKKEDDTFLKYEKEYGTYVNDNKNEVQVDEDNIDLQSND